MWPVHVAVDVENEMMNDGGCNVSVNFQIEHQRAMTRRKMAFPNERKEEWKKNEHKSNWTTEREREKKREVSHILIYEPSLRFKGNKSDTTCLQTLKCHRSIAQLTPIGAVMSSIEEWKRKTKNKMDHNKLKFLYIGRQNDKCQVVWSLFPPFSSSSSSSSNSDVIALAGVARVQGSRASPECSSTAQKTLPTSWQSCEWSNARCRRAENSSGKNGALGRARRGWGRRQSGSSN